MLGVLTVPGRGAADLLLARVAGVLAGEGWPLGGAVQVNRDHAVPGRKCHMDLHILGTDQVVCISQDLGAGSRGCRLDAAGLETAVGLAEAALLAGPRPRLVILNKFGKREVDGGGFRPLIGRALEMGVPVLTAVGTGNLEGFEGFAEGLAERVGATEAEALAWCRRVVAEAV